MFAGINRPDEVPSMAKKTVRRCDVVGCRSTKPNRMGMCKKHQKIYDATFKK